MQNTRYNYDNLHHYIPTMVSLSLDIHSTSVDYKICLILVLSDKMYV